ncbi:unnamed protein product [Ixodes persulcatus]
MARAELRPFDLDVVPASWRSRRQACSMLKALVDGRLHEVRLRVVASGQARRPQPPGLGKVARARVLKPRTPLCFRSFGVAGEGVARRRQPERTPVFGQSAALAR